MNRLGYSAKFGVMILLIALPLSYLATQQFNAARSQLDEARQQSLGLQVLTHSHAVIGAIENWRDATVLRFLSSDAEIERLHGQVTQSVIERIDALTAFMNNHHVQVSPFFMRELKTQLNRPVVAPGMEGISFELVFDNVQRTVSEMYAWQRKVASQFNLLGLRDAKLYATVNLVLYDSGPVFESVGMARAAGAYYLFTQLLDSNSIYMIDKAYTRLDKEVERIQSRQIALGDDDANPASEFNQYTQAFHQLMGMLDAHLIQVTELNLNWREYFRDTTKIKENARSYEQNLLASALTEVRHIERDRRDWVNQFLLITGGILVLIILLYVGFYYSVKRTITRLIRSAEAVAGGDLDHVMHTETRDELSHLGHALDNMRAQLKVRQMRLRHLSITDGLTGLKNRKFFDEVMQAETNKAARGNYPMALILLDIDHFKSINDRYGHVVGDACLQYVANRLRQQLKRSSDVAARYGGEEFAVILPNTLPDQCLAIAEQFRAEIEQSVIVVDHHTITCTVSCGIASMVPGTGEDTLYLVQAADSALYAAKHAGRNRCLLGQSMPTRRPAAGQHPPETRESDPERHVS